VKYIKPLFFLKMILKEGLDTLDITEIQQACRERGMRALGMPEARLKAQLAQWLDLHLNKKIPISLLILSRALYLPENLPAGDLIKTTISALPLSIVRKNFFFLNLYNTLKLFTNKNKETAVKAEIAEASGEKLDNQIRLELLKIEEKEIKLEKVETAATAEIPVTHESPVPSTKPQPTTMSKVEEKDFAAAQLAKETLVDKAPIIQSDVLTPVEIKEINKIIENLPSSEKQSVKSEIVELKKDVSEYKEDIKEVETMSQTKQTVALKETKAAKALGNRVSKLIADIDQIVDKMEKNAPEERRLGLKYLSFIKSIVRLKFKIYFKFKVKM
jgi:LETM1 and EF-hand domain-containing protein 1, mitochondrial